MKNRFMYLVTEYMVANLLALFFVWKFCMAPRLQNPGADISSEIEASLLVYAVVLFLITIGIVVQGYFQIMKPFLSKVREMEIAVEESRRAESIRKEFVANVSHELKTPLTSISGFIETLQAGAAEDPEIRTKFIDIIAIETSRLKRLIEDLLVLSEIENKKDAEERVFDVRNAVESTVLALEPLAEDKHIDIVTKIDEGISITGSVDRFRQMLVNLIENAIKYSDEGSHVWVSAEDDGQHVTVSVKDEGIGIAPEHHDRLFERFYRVDKSRSKKVGGTGLGLSIVKHIAVLFGAKLKVESEVGKGSTFFVIFDKNS
ncbi:MAG: ATP-binding protein [Clostridiales bacterium]|nr:ATP-binding protein [Clostridiales bacterium]